MKLIVGLGNPGRRYEQTRHNIGFTVAARVATLIGAGPVKIRFEGEVAEGSVTEKLVVLCPQTYMNLSGKSVRKACDFYKLNPDDVLVICDDLNLPVGRLRLRASGSAGGQKGLADIVRHLGTDNIARLRIGIDRPPSGWDPSDYVLGKFGTGEQKKIEDAISLAAQAAIDWSDQGIGFVMNRYNAEQKPGKKKDRKRVQRKRETGSGTTGSDATRPDAEQSSDKG